MGNEQEERRPRVVLLALDQGKFDARRSLDELTALAEADGMEVAADQGLDIVALQDLSQWEG